MTDIFIFSRVGAVLFFTRIEETSNGRITLNLYVDACTCRRNLVDCSKEIRLDGGFKETHTFSKILYDK